ncbi:MAG: LLM class flavin-dependent oxidoreductase [Pseudomonadota bacterium]
MRIGISVCSNYRVEDPRLGAKYMIERARAARQADLDTLFVGDHHVVPVPYYQNVPILGRMLAEWHNKPAGALFLLPLWNPVLLAEQIGTLASIMQGRFIMQCGLGDTHQSQGMGIDDAKRVGMFNASIDIMRRLWAGETVSHDKYWPIQNAQINPVPAEPVEIWVGAVAPAAINRTARVAEGWLASPSLTLAAATDALNLYRQACAEHDRTPTAVAIRRDVFIATNEKEVQTFKTRLSARGHRGFSEEALLIGTINQVKDELAQFAELGYTDVIMRNISTDQSEALSTIELLAQVAEAL